MYFPNAFRKSFLPVSTTLASSGGTDALTAGQIGFFDAKSYQVVSAQAAPFILAQGSYFAADKIGPVHGGYKESVKSKVINPKYISRVIKVTSDAAQNQIVSVDPSAATIYSDNTYRLRLDVKGSPALRFVSRNLYDTLDGFSGCDTVAGTTNTVDQNVVLLSWKDQVNESLLLKEFVVAKVWNMTTASVAIDPTAASATIIVANADAALFQVGEKVVHASLAGASYVVSIGAADSASAGNANIVLSKAAVASTNGNAKIYSQIATGTYAPVVSSANDIAAVDSHIEITAAYVETKFGACTFTPTDFYGLEPLFIYTSFVEESGDPCATNLFASAELQAPKQASGLGETVLRELILDGRYLQNAYPDSSRVDSLRMREIEADPALNAVVKGNLYDQVLILHNVPRFNNPSSTFDNDQYLIVVHVPTGTATTSITNFIVSSASAAGNAVSLETV
jgi:hypothetical protein